MALWNLDQISKKPPRNLSISKKPPRNVSMVEELRESVRDRNTTVSTLLHELVKVEHRFNSKINILLRKLRNNEEAIQSLTSCQPIEETQRKRKKTSSATFGSSLQEVGVRKKSRPCKQQIAWVNIDKNTELEDYAAEIDQYTRDLEGQHRASVDYMETFQMSINPQLRAILINWIVEIAEEPFSYSNETLFLTVNYIDRFLSRNLIDSQQLQLVGVTCLIIAAKYEERQRIELEQFSLITDGLCSRDAILKMECDILTSLNFDLTVATATCFLRRFICASRGSNEAASMDFECLANYILELSLLHYSMLCFAPSLLAAASIFLANLLLFPANKPWNPTLRHYTLYKPSDLRNCVNILHYFFCKVGSHGLSRIVDKYSKQKYECVAQKHFLSSIPVEAFRN